MWWICISDNVPALIWHFCQFPGSGFTFLTISQNSQGQFPGNGVTFPAISNNIQALTVHLCQFDIVDLCYWQRPGTVKTFLPLSSQWSYTASNFQAVDLHCWQWPSTPKAYLAISSGIHKSTAWKLAEMPCECMDSVGNTNWLGENSWIWKCTARKLVDL
jgi:hypothetical protein